MSSKYGNKKTMVDGIVFDSKREADRYRELKLLERAGEINDLRLQVPFTLLPGFTVDGERFRPVTYVADFVYFDLMKQRMVVEDAKGYRTREYNIKKKLFAYSQGMTIKEV